MTVALLLLLVSSYERCGRDQPSSSRSPWFKPPSTLSLSTTYLSPCLAPCPAVPMQPTDSPAPSPVPGGLSKEVPLDGALRQKLYEILEDVKTYWRVSRRYMFRSRG